MATAWVERKDDGAGVLLSAGGPWTATEAGALDLELNKLLGKINDGVRFDLAEVEQMDTIGAWLIHRTRRDLLARGLNAELLAVKPAHAAVLERVAANDRPAEDDRQEWNPFVRILRRTGLATVNTFQEIKYSVGFVGQVFAALCRCLVRPSRLRGTALVLHMERVGVNALPIVSLVAFLIGVVLTYQGMVQLKRFGAEIFVVNMVSVSVLREIGILLTAIVMAGRSGSAFTAEIGTMIVNEEVDAMRVLGLDPMQVLVLPRILALVLMLPVLTFVADIMGLFGGMLLCWGVLDISPRLFLEQMKSAVDIWTFAVGMIKAPVFALLIGLTGCLQGLRVSGSAASVGERTTNSVVASIFLIIIADAAFSILFSLIGM